MFILIRSDLHLRFLQWVGTHPTVPHDTIQMLGGGGVAGVVTPIQVGLTTGPIPPGTVSKLSAVGTGVDIIVYVLGGEHESIITV